MKQNIYSIPISEVFEPKCGCPVCRLHDTLETRCVEYIMGAAMMEPDIRIQTNALGFCADHYKMMLERPNRLSLALILESRLAQLEQQVATDAFVPKKSLTGKKSTLPRNTCYVCSEIDSVMHTMTENIISLWQKDAGFRELVAQQPAFCLQHYRLLCDTASGKLSSKDFAVFHAVIKKITSDSLSAVREDVSHFCSMFDYRNAGTDKDWGNSKDSPERAVTLLTSKVPVKNKK